jgi:uncharacterized protein
MALFARSRNREVELERRVSALQNALSQCKGVAQQWWSFRATFTVAVVVVALAVGFTLGVYRHAISQAFIETAAAVGLANPRGDQAAEADAAFQKADYAKALKLARPLAEEGNAKGESILGFAYYRGRGVPQNDAEAANWFKRAAEQGDAPSRFTLGVMYGEGRGVPQDFAEAARWYRRAAEQGDAQAQYNLAAARFPATDTRNRTAAVKNRDTVAGEMSSEQLAEAQKRAREWKPQS